MKIARLDIESMDDGADGRLYAIPHGDDFVYYPSVTTVLDRTKTAADRNMLESWKLRVGADEAERVRVDAADRGTALHAEVAAYLDDPFRDPERVSESPWFNSMRGILGQIAEPILIEAPVWHSAGYAGTLDLMAKGKRGGVALFDWKTSNQRKKREWIRDYELQIGAYAGAVKERYGVSVDAACVVVASDDGRPADAFWLDVAQLRSMFGAFRMRFAQFLATEESAPEPWSRAR